MATAVPVRGVGCILKLVKVIGRITKYVAVPVRGVGCIKGTGTVIVGMELLPSP